MTAPAPGVYELGDAAYNDLPALRSSDLPPALLSWAHFNAARRMPREDTDAFLLGRLAHAMVRGVADDEFRVIVGPTNPTTGKPYGADSAKYREFMDAARKDDSRDIVTTADWREAEAFAKAVHECPEAVAAMAEAKAEVSFVGRIEGVVCKCRVDYWREADASWTDLKTTRHPAAAFPRTAANLHYLLKAAFQALVMESALRARPALHRWIVVEKSPPFGVIVWTMRAEDLLPWCDKVRELVQQYASCEATGVWPGYAGGERELEPKPWDYPNAVVTAGEAVEW